MNNSPLISIVIPTYNHAHFLRIALQSVIDQRYTNWETIVIDNHSSDNTEHIIASLDNPKIKLLKIHNNGVIGAVITPFVVQVFAQNIAKVIGSGVDLLFCNQDEALSYTNSNNLEDAIEGLKSIAKTFVITQGENGATAFDGVHIASVPGVTTEAVDTNGAGDMFAGAFLYAITSGQNYEWALGFANAAAARVVSQFGPRVTSIEYDRIKAQFNIS